MLLVCDDQNTITGFAYGIFPLFSLPVAFYGHVSIFHCEILPISLFEYQMHPIFAFSLYHFAHEVIARD